MNRYFYQNGVIPLYRKNGELLDLMEHSIVLFNLRDKFLMKNGYYEVSMVHCVAQHMTALIKNDYRFRGMFVDIEHNKGEDGNTYASKVLCNSSGELREDIRLDLVVTEREYDEQLGFHNLLCAEFKKMSNRVGWESDRDRLRMLTSLDRVRTGGKIYGYFIGFFVLIDDQKMWIENAYDALGELPKDEGRIVIPDGRYDRLI